MSRKASEPARPQAAFRFAPFSRRQKQVLTWWTDASPYRDYNGIIADGSIRSGKTLTVLLSFVAWATTRFTGKSLAFCGRTIGSLRRNVLSDEYLDVLRNRGYAIREKKNERGPYLIISRGERVNTFYMFGGHDEQSYTLVQGVTLAGVLLDEVVLMPQSFVNQALARCSVEGAKYWFTCNPAEPLHWFKTDWINQYQAKRLLYLHFTMDDNLSLSEGKKAQYASMYVGVFHRRYVLGLWCAAEGIIYDMWDDDRNLYDDGPLPWDDMLRYIAIDYGTTNPMVFLDAWDDGTTFRIRREYYWDSRKRQRQKTDSEYADDLDAFTDGDHDACLIIDPSAASFIAECRKRGYRVKEADNAVSDGIRMTSTLIAKGRLMVERGCRNLRREIESYIWNDKSARHGVEEPVKANDHAMDAMRYLVKTVANRWRM